MDLVSIRTQIGAWLSLVIPGVEVLWENRPHGYHNGPWVTCDIASIVPVGRDCTRFDYNLSTDDLTPVTGGNRRFTVRIKVHSFRPVDGADAYHFVTRLQDSISAPSVTDLFKLADIGYRSVLSVVDLTNLVPDQDRTLSCAQIDVSFHALGEFTGINIPHVKTWGIKSNLKMPDGTVSPVQIDGSFPT
jgi:hypothetical protein